MRTTPLIGHKVWFGPRRFGWGLDPVSPEGWAVVVVSVVAASLARSRGERGKRAARLVGLGMLAVALAKGTAPGGPRRARQFRALRAGAQAPEREAA